MVWSPGEEKKKKNPQGIGWGWLTLETVCQRYAGPGVSWMDVASACPGPEIHSTHDLPCCCDYDSIAHIVILGLW